MSPTPPPASGRTDTDGDEGGDGQPASGGTICRRHVLSGIGGLGATALAGCLGGSGTETPEPPGAVTIPDDATCDVCGMMISKHPGPSAQVFYADSQPNGHSNPARFDSTWEAFKFDFERDDWTRQSFYVTDYSSVEYQITTDQEQKLISRHVGAETFIDATEVTFVAASDVIGTMGKDLLGFSSSDDAEAFRTEHGGELVTFDEVTPTLISQLGK